MSKKKFIKKILPIPSESKYVIHDHWIGLVVSLNGKLAYMPEKYIKYRQHDNNQMGADKNKYKEFKQMRSSSINAKIEIFQTYINNKNIFPEELQLLNEEAYNYFLEIKDKEKFNFKKWRVFHILYKNEKISKYITGFITMNLPFVGNPIFKIRYYILKMLGRI